MRVLLTLVLLLVAVPVARADEGKAEDPEVTVSVVAAEEAPATPELVLEEVKVPESRAAEAAEAAAQEMPRRGSFWWLVGVIVVAGIILAVVLD